MQGYKAMISKDRSQDSNPSGLTHRTMLPLCSAAFQTRCHLCVRVGVSVGQHPRLGAGGGRGVVVLRVFASHIFIIAAKLHS